MSACPKCGLDDHKLGPGPERWKHGNCMAFVCPMRRQVSRSCRAPTGTELQVADALRAECLKIFGTTWSNDVARQLARASIRALHGVNHEVLDVGCTITRRASGEMAVAWNAMIDKASPPEEP